MPDTVVISDTSVLITLSKIGELDLLLKVYDRVLVTPEILDEFGELLPTGFEIKPVSNQAYQDVIEATVDKGEASAIALANEIPNSVLILDDRKARVFAKKLGFKVTGTLGVVSKARERNIISEIRPILYRIQQTDFRISEKLIEELLLIHGEA